MKSGRVLTGLVFSTASAERRALEDHDRHDLIGLVADFLLQRLQDDVGDVEPRERVAVGLGPGELAPPQCTAAAHLVVDDHLLTQDPVEVRLVEPGAAVRLPPRIETDHVGELAGGEGLFLRECLAQGCAQQNGRDPDDPCRCFHAGPPLR